VKKLLRTSITLLSFLFLFTNCATFSKRAPIGQSPQKLEIKTTLNYLLYLPDGYNTSSEDWPIMLFLHGAGERGADLNVVKKHGPPKLVDQISNMPFIIISPQCPEGDWWTAKINDLDALLNHISNNYRVDENRIYVTGLSMGGYGTWALATAFPDRFAAIVPICGGGESLRIKKLKDVPTWVFHGAKDKSVPIAESQKLVDILKASGSDVKFTIYPEAGHDSWTETYKNPELYKWFLEQSL
jgi:predicted peptidase